MGRTMRVLHVTSGNLYGGIETLLVTLARRRDLCPEMEPHFAVCFEGRLSAELRDAGVPVSALGAVRMRDPLSVWRARRALKRVLEAGGFDAVVCHSAWPQTLFGHAVRASATPLVLWQHGPYDEHNWLDRVARSVRPDLIVANSKFTAASLRPAYSGVPIRVVYCAVSPPDAPRVSRDAIRDALDTPRSAVVIVQVSRMEPWKGHALLLEALRSMTTKTEWACWIVGGPQRDEESGYFERLRREVGRLELEDRVRFLGQRSDVFDLLSAADLFCQPNTGPEPFGIVFVEALYAGLPVVTTATGGALEIVDETCGILVPEPKAPLFAPALDRLVDSADERNALGRSGPERAARLCAPDRVLRSLRTALDKVTPTAATAAR